MEESVLDQNFSEKPNVEYGGFWLRLVALILDGIILAPITVGLMVFNAVSLKSLPVIIITTVLGTLYKPFMEYQYGATLGKMILKLKVVDLDYGKITFGAALLRSIFQLIQAVFTILASAAIFSAPGFDEIEGIMDYLTFSGSAGGVAANLNNALSLVFLVDGIVGGVDAQKRTIHDRIAKTYVIQG